MIAKVADRPTILLSGAQIGLLLALEDVFQAAGLVVVCPHCLRSKGRGELTTDNAPGDAVWKMNCACRDRKADPRSVGTVPAPSGDLLPLAEAALAGADLVIRCPSRTCRHRPLEMRQTPEGLLVTCECARLQFRKTRPAPPMV